MDTLVLQDSAGLQNVTGLRVGPRTPRSRRAKDLHGREIERERERESKKQRSREAERAGSREKGKQRESKVPAHVFLVHTHAGLHTLSHRDGPWS